MRGRRIRRNTLPALSDLVQASKAAKLQKVEHRTHECPGCQKSFRSRWRLRSHRVNADRETQCWDGGVQVAARLNFVHARPRRPDRVAASGASDKEASDEGDVEAPGPGDDHRARGSGRGLSADYEVARSVQERSYSSDEYDRNVEVDNVEFDSSDEADVEWYDVGEYDDEDVEYGDRGIDDSKYQAPVEGSHPDVAWAQAQANHTWFCNNSDVDWKDKHENRAWPFPSHSHALLYFWLIAGGTPISASTFTQLLVLLQDPKFNPREDLQGVTDYRSFFHRAEKYLPMARPVSETVPQKTIVKRTTKRSGHTTGGGQVRTVEQFALSSCKVDGLGIIDHIKRVYATPSLRNKIRDQAYEDPGDKAPTQFNQVPFCKEPLKYMHLRTFFHRTGADGELTEFRVDDVVELRDSTVMRIDKLTYRALDLGNKRSVAASSDGADVFPVLVLTGPVFRPVNEVYVCHEGTVVNHQAHAVTKKLTVGTSREHKDDVDIVCTTIVSPSGMHRVYTPRETSLTFRGGGG